MMMVMVAMMTFLLFSHLLSLLPPPIGAVIVIILGSSLLADYLTKFFNLPLTYFLLLLSKLSIVFCRCQLCTFWQFIAHPNLVMHVIKSKLCSTCWTYFHIATGVMSISFCVENTTIMTIFINVVVCSVPQVILAIYLDISVRAT